MELPLRLSLVSLLHDLKSGKAFRLLDSILSYVNCTSWAKKSLLISFNGLLERFNIYRCRSFLKDWGKSFKPQLLRLIFFNLINSPRFSCNCNLLHPLRSICSKSLSVLIEEGMLVILRQELNLIALSLGRWFKF